MSVELSYSCKEAEACLPNVESCATPVIWRNSCRLLSPSGHTVWLLVIEMMYSSVCGIALLLPFLKVGKATISGQVQQPISLSNKEALFDSAFDAFVEATLQEWHVPGLSIAVVENGKIASKVWL